MNNRTKQALEQPAQQQEPVAWADMDVRGEDKGLSWTSGHFHKTPLYTVPQQDPVAPKCGAIIEVFGKDWRLEYLCLPVGRHKLYTQQYTYTSPPASKPWVGLSTVELDEIDAPIRERGHATVAEIYRAIEAKLREKNT